MSKTITSPVKRWPGAVVLSDPLNYPQSIAIEEALETARTIEDKRSAAYRNALLPGICACVEKWEIEGLGQLTPDNFPSTPIVSSSLLVAWLLGEIVKLFRDGDEIPNA